MKLSRKIPAFLMCLAVLFLPGCGRRDSGWGGTITVENGITVVRNPSEPLYPGEVVRFEEELSIGASEGEEMELFSSIYGMDVDREGNIFVLDRTEPQLRVFAPDGTFLRTIGRKGQGPGEMDNPRLIQVTPNGEVMVYDPVVRRMVFYSREGTFLRNSSIAEISAPMGQILRDGTGCGLAYLIPPPPQGAMLVRCGEDFSQLETLAQIPEGNPGILRYMGPQPTFALMPDGWAWAVTDRYSVVITDRKGKPVRRIERDHSPVPIPSSYKEEQRKGRLRRLIDMGIKIDFPEAYPPIGDIFADPEGRIFVSTYERCETGEDCWYMDAFDKEGRYLTRFPLRFSLNRGMIWKGGKLYRIEADEEGYHMIKRYHVRWDFPDR